MKFRDYSNYEVFEDGRIWSYKSNKFLKPATTRGGYQQVKLYDNEGGKKSYYLHRVVYEAVTSEPIPEGFDVNHISEVKTENFFANLNLLTRKENVNFGSGIERRAKTHSKLNKNGKLSKQVGAYINGELIMTFPSTREAGRNGFNQGHIASCCRGEIKSHKGYEWRYI